MDQSTMNIGSLCGGSIPEVFDKTLNQVLKNITDINTPAEQKRQITITITFKPAENRELGEVSFKCEAKLASVKPAKGNFFLSRRGTEVRGYCRDPKQETLFREETPATPEPQ
jgi:hypothetical protein